jgi:hypothetical protein
MPTIVRDCKRPHPVHVVAGPGLPAFFHLRFGVMGIPWFDALLVWYATRFGEGTLDQLREHWGLGRRLIEVAIGVSLFRLYGPLRARKASRKASLARRITAGSDAAAAAIFAPLASRMRICLDRLGGTTGGAGIAESFNPVRGEGTDPIHVLVSFRELSGAGT